MLQGPMKERLSLCFKAWAFSSCQKQSCTAGKRCFFQQDRLDSANQIFSKNIALMSSVGVYTPVQTLIPSLLEAGLFCSGWLQKKRALPLAALWVFLLLNANRNYWCFWIVMLETLESSLHCKVIKPVNSKGNQSWRFIGRTDAEAETPVLWPPDEKNWLIGKDPDAGKGWRQEEKGATEGEMVGWHHWIDVREFEQALGVGNRQGSLASCSPWGHKESDITERLNCTEEIIMICAIKYKSLSVLLFFISFLFVFPFTLPLLLVR